MYADYITMHKEELISAKINELGQFNFEFEVSSFSYLTLSLNEKLYSFYTPEIANLNFIFDSEDNLISIIDPDSINFYSQQIENDITEFFNRRFVLTKREKQIPDLINLLTSKYSGINNYLDEIISYKIARLRFLIADDANDQNEILKIEQDYLINKININSHDYWQFAKYFYYNWSNRLKLRRAPFANNQYDYFTKEYSTIPNDTLRQFMLLQLCYVSTNKKEWEDFSNKFFQLADSVGKHALNNQILQVANNVIVAFNDSMIGKSIPELTFTDQFNNKLSINDFNGKYLLIDFWHVGCSYCIEAFSLIEKFRARNSDKIEFLSINPIDSPERTHKFLKKRNYPWFFTSIDKSETFFNFFKVNGYPAYFLLNPEGELLWIPPSFVFKNFQSELESIINDF
ncbi:MAG TPA: TlpA disulfide reductase family protein [Cyclobacteriaceae bacterium]|nr:TlpA disulfide reductase family protein [Cyclobacteriaceae bacterium]